MFRLLQLSIAKESMNRYFNGIGSRSSSSSSTIGSKSRSGSTSTAYLAPFCQVNKSTCSVDPEFLKYIVSPTASATLRLRSSAMLKSPPMKYEEDVIVMDGIVVNGNKSIRRNSSLTELKSVVNNHVMVIDELLMNKSNSFGDTTEFNSSGRDNSAGDLGNAEWKRELCMMWMEMGRCRFGSECQLAHGKEELRGNFAENRIPRLACEVSGNLARKTQPNAGSSSKVCGSSCPSPRPKSPNPYLGPYPSPVQMKKTTSKSNFIPEISSMPTLLTSFNWPPTEEEEKLITCTLYGPSTKRRLPVFEQLCPQ